MELKYRISETKNTEKWELLPTVQYECGVVF